MWRIRKEIIDGIEYLPDIVHTDLWPAYEETVYKRKGTKEIRLAAGLYKHLSERENYFQENTPTAFGNPKYNELCGLVSGFIQGSEMVIKETDDEFVVCRGRKVVLIVDKIKRNPAYREAARENAEILRDLGIGGYGF